MNPELLNQATEIVKNLNVVFDGKLNSETAVQITEKITQYLMFVQVKGLVVSIIWAVAVIISAKLIGSAIIKTGE